MGGAYRQDCQDTSETPVVAITYFQPLKKFSTIAIENISYHTAATAATAAAMGLAGNKKK